MEDALSDYEQTLLFVSHDRYFIEKFATRIWALADGKITDFRGSYRDFCNWRERQAVFAQNDRQRASASEKRPLRKRRSPARRVRRTMRSPSPSLKKEIAKLEAQSAELDRQAEEFSSDYQKLMDIQQQKDALDEELLALYERWGGAERMRAFSNRCRTGCLPISILLVLALFFKFAMRGYGYIAFALIYAAALVTLCRFCA